MLGTPEAEGASASARVHAHAHPRRAGARGQASPRGRGHRPRPRRGLRARARPLARPARRPARHRALQDRGARRTRRRVRRVRLRRDRPTTRAAIATVPKCQSLAQARWVEQRMERILPDALLPRRLHAARRSCAPLALRQPRGDLRPALRLRRRDAARRSAAIRERLGAELGVTSVLHTWTRELALPPARPLHRHRRRPVARRRALGRRRAATSSSPCACSARCSAASSSTRLRRAYDRGELRLDGPRGAARRRRLLRPPAATSSTAKRWVVYAKPPFGGPEQVFRYLGRYTHRVGLSNHRLVSLDEHGVTFRTRGDKHRHRLTRRVPPALPLARPAQRLRQDPPPRPDGREQRPHQARRRATPPRRSARRRFEQPSCSTGTSASSCWRSPASTSAPARAAVDRCVGICSALLEQGAASFIALNDTS